MGSEFTSGATKSDGFVHNAVVSWRKQPRRCMNTGHPPHQPRRSSTRGEHCPRVSDVRDMQLTLNVVYKSHKRRGPRAKPRRVIPNELLVAGFEGTAQCLRRAHHKYHVQNTGSACVDSEACERTRTLLNKSCLNVTLLAPSAEGLLVARRQLPARERTSTTHSPERECVGNSSPQSRQCTTHHGRQTQRIKTGG